jgi:hypothetical protein
VPAPTGPLARSSSTGGLVTGRNRGSLDAFCGRILEEFAEGVRAEQRRRA